MILWVIGLLFVSNVNSEASSLDLSQFDQDITFANGSLMLSHAILDLDRSGMEQQRKAELRLALQMKVWIKLAASNPKGFIKFLDSKADNDGDDEVFKVFGAKKFSGIGSIKWLCTDGAEGDKNGCDKVVDMGDKTLFLNNVPAALQKSLKLKGIYQVPDVPLHGYTIAKHALVRETPSLKLNKTEIPDTFKTTEVLGKGRFPLHVGSHIQLFKTAEDREDAIKFESHGWLHGHNHTVFSKYGVSSTAGKNVEVVGSQKWLLFRVFFDDSPNGDKIEDTWTGQALTDEQFTNSLTKIQSNIQLSSFGRYILDVDNSVMTPTFKLSGFTASDISKHGWVSALDAARVYAKDNFNIDWEEFGSDLLITSHDNSIPYAGQAWVGLQGGHLNGAWDSKVYLHEVGHNFGMHHASAWSHEMGSVSESSFDASNANLVEYGDTFDIMGGGGIEVSQFNAEKRVSILGWIDDEFCPLVTEDADIMLYPIDKQTSAGKTVCVRVPETEPKKVRFSNGKEYTYDQHTFEFQGAKDDEYLANGLVHTIKSGSRSILIDQEFESTSVEDAPMEIGESFSDCSRGLHVTAVGKGLCPAGQDGEMCMQVNVRIGSPNVGIFAELYDYPRETVEVSQKVYFSAKAYSDTGEGPAELVWNVEGTEYIQMNDFTHAFKTAGRKTVHLVATNFMGAFTEYTIAVDVVTGSQTEHLDPEPLFEGSIDVTSADEILEYPDADLVSTGLDSFSITGNVRLNKFSGRRWLFSKGGDTGTVGVVLNQDDLIGSVRIVYTALDSTRVSVLGEHEVDVPESFHWAATVAPGHVKFYINGQLVQEAITDLPIIVNDSPLQLGGIKGSGLDTNSPIRFESSNSWYNGIYYPAPAPEGVEHRGQYQAYAGKEGPSTGSGEQAYSWLNCWGTWQMKKNGAGCRDSYWFSFRGYVPFEESSGNAVYPGSTTYTVSRIATQTFTDASFWNVKVHDSTLSIDAILNEMIADKTEGSGLVEGLSSRGCKGNSNPSASASASASPSRTLTPSPSKPEPEHTMSAEELKEHEKIIEESYKMMQSKDKSIIKTLKFVIKIQAKINRLLRKNKTASTRSSYRTFMKVESRKLAAYTELQKARLRAEVIADRYNLMKEETEDPDKYANIADDAVTVLAEIEDSFKEINATYREMSSCLGDCTDKNYQECSELSDRCIATLQADFF